MEGSAMTTERRLRWQYLLVPLASGAAASFLVLFLMHFGWSSPGEPTFEFQETKFDAGKIETSFAPDVHHRFAFQNVGRQELVISDVRTSCGCTVAALPKMRYAPGESGYLDVTLSIGQIGLKAQEVQILSNAPGGDVWLGIAGNWQPVAASVAVPHTVAFGPTSSKARRAIQIEVFVQDEGVIPELTSLKSSRGAVRARLLNSDASVTSTTVGYFGRSFEVEVQPGDETGPFNDEVVFSFTPATIPALKIPVSGVVRSGWRTVPEQAVFAIATHASWTDNSPPQILTLESDDDAEDVVWDIKANPYSSWLRVQIARSSGRPFSWEMSLAPTTPPPADCADGIITIEAVYGTVRQSLAVPVIIRRFD
jgi:hypothetical protein